MIRLEGEYEEKRPRASRALKIVLAIVAIFAFPAVVYHFMRQPDLVPLIRVGTISESHMLVPGSGRRLIIVGDVHGMYTEFRKLLRKVDFNEENDLVVLMGDFTTKGPDSQRVIEYAEKIGAACVRGNHEDEIVSLYAEVHKLEPPQTYPPYASEHVLTFGDSPRPTLDPTKGPYRGDGAPLPGPTEAPKQDNVVIQADRSRDMPLARRLKREHMDYIAKCPAMLHLGNVTKYDISGVACHGGLAWYESELEEQDPQVVLRVRGFLPPNYLQPTEEKESEPWYRLWGDAQRDLPKKRQRTRVFYGHDASKGLQIHKYSRGLDTQCTKGGSLSALVVSVSDKGNFKEKLIQIDC